MYSSQTRSKAHFSLWDHTEIVAMIFHDLLPGCLLNFSIVTRLPALPSDTCHCGQNCTILFPSASAATAPVNLTQRAVKTPHRSRIYCLCKKHGFQLHEAQCSWGFPLGSLCTEQFHTTALPCQCHRTAALLQGPCQHRGHRTATSLFLTLYFGCLQG